MGGRAWWLSVATALLVHSMSGCGEVARRAETPNDGNAGDGSVAPPGGSSEGGSREPVANAAGATTGSDLGGQPASGAAGASGEPAGGAAGAAGSEAEPCPSCDAVGTEPSDFGMTWRDSWFLMGCKEKHPAYCETAQAASCTDDESVPFEDRGAITLETFPIGGTPGQNYKVTFQFNAIVSAKEYSGGTRDAGTTLPADPHRGHWDAFHREGAPTPTNYSSWKLSVLDETGVELRHYYMNSFPPGLALEEHRTFLLSYRKSIVVVGGGKVTHRVQAPKCRAIDNCLSYGGVVCQEVSYLPNERRATMPPAVYQDPEDGVVKPSSELTVFPQGQPWHTQLGHLTITGVEPTGAPVTHDFVE